MKQGVNRGRVGGSKKKRKRIIQSLKNRKKKGVAKRERGNKGLVSRREKGEDFVQGVEHKGNREYRVSVFLPIKVGFDRVDGPRELFEERL